MHLVWDRFKGGWQRVGDERPGLLNESALTRDYEAGLYGHYNRHGYWVDELVAG